MQATNNNTPMLINPFQALEVADLTETMVDSWNEGVRSIG